MDLIEITEVTRTIDTTIEFLRDKNLLLRTFYCCQQECRVHQCKTSDKSEFRCLLCKKSYSIRYHSFFYDIHINLSHLLLLIYLFAANTSVALSSRYLGKNVSKKSISSWYHCLRDVMSQYLVTNPIHLGNADSVVEVDETCLGRKRKYNRGSFRGSGQKWILGIIDRNTQKCHVQMIPDRKRDTLVPIIEQYVLPDTVIHTDEAPMYRVLNQLGFEHYTVCHRDHYVAPDGTHTNTIEGLWSHLKDVFKQKHGVPNDKLPAHLDEFLYRWNRKNEGPVFELLLQDIATQNPL